MILYIIGVIGQYAACVFLGLGVAVEIVTQADIGYLAITIGSVLFAGMVKVKSAGKERVIKENERLKQQLNGHDPA